MVKSYFISFVWKRLIYLNEKINHKTFNFRNFYHIYQTLNYHQTISSEKIKWIHYKMIKIHIKWMMIIIIELISVLPSTNYMVRFFIFVPAETKIQYLHIIDWFMIWILQNLFFVHIIYQYHIFNHLHCYHDRPL